MLEEVEAYLEARSHRSLEHFFSQPFRLLVQKVYGVNGQGDSWIQHACARISDVEPARIARFLHPCSTLVCSAREADESQVNFSFPPEQLPPIASSMMHSSSGAARLAQQLPYAGCVAEGGMSLNGPIHPRITLSVYTYLIFWLACSTLRFSSPPEQPKSRFFWANAHEGKMRSRLNIWAVDLCAYIALLHLRHFLPALSPHSQPYGRRVCSPTEQSAEAPSVSHCRSGGNVPQGIALVSIFAEFWLAESFFTEKSSTSWTAPSKARLRTSRWLVWYLVRSYSIAAERGDQQEEILRRALHELAGRLYTFLSSCFLHWPSEGAPKHLYEVATLWHDFTLPWNARYPSESGLQIANLDPHDLLPKQSGIQEYLSNVSQASKQAFHTRASYGVTHGWKGWYMQHFSHFYTTLLQRFIHLCERRVTADADANSAPKDLKRMIRHFYKTNEDISAAFRQVSTSLYDRSEAVRSIATIIACLRVRINFAYFFFVVCDVFIFCKTKEEHR